LFLNFILFFKATQNSSLAHWLDIKPGHVKKITICLKNELYRYQFFKVVVKQDLLRL